MLRLVLASCLLGITLASVENYQLCYTSSANSTNTCMSVQTDEEANTIYYEMVESDDFEKVESLEDFDVGLAASRVESQEACYVRRLVNSFEGQVTFLKAHQDTPMKALDDIRVTAIPLDNPEEELGADLANFCADLPVYKLVKKEEEEEEEEEEDQDVDHPSRRQVSVTFTRCVLLFFIPTCFSTTLTLPTGSTIIFGWFFFG